MEEETKQILRELKEIRAELDYIKGHMIDSDTLLTDDDVESLKQAEKELKKKKTKRLVWIYSVELSQRSYKFLDKLDRHIRERIETRLKNLSQTPIPSDAKFIVRDNDGDKIFRYRIGDYRALYKVKEKEKIVLVTKIDKRPRIHKNL